MASDMSRTAAERVVYAMNPSGADKDTLLDFELERVGPRVVFAHRYITRPIGAGENHIALTDEEFSSRLANGVFALNW